MKKMSLKIAQASLSRDEMRSITGGSGGGSTCNLQCGNWSRTMEVANCSSSTAAFYCGSTSNVTRCNCY